MWYHSKNVKYCVVGALDARYTWLYGLSCDDLRYVLDSNAVKREDCLSETFRMLKEREIAEFWGISDTEAGVGGVGRPVRQPKGCRSEMCHGESPSKCAVLG